VVKIYENLLFNDKPKTVTAVCRCTPEYRRQRKGCGGNHGFEIKYSHVPVTDTVRYPLDNTSQIRVYFPQGS